MDEKDQEIKINHRWIKDKSFSQSFKTGSADQPDWTLRQSGSCGVKIYYLVAYNAGEHAFWPAAVLRLGSLFLIVIPVTVHFFAVRQTTRKQWAHVSVWWFSSIMHGGCGRLSPLCSASAAMATPVGTTGRIMSRQSGWLKPPPQTVLSGIQAHILTVLWLCSFQMVVKPQASNHSSCDTHMLTAVWKTKTHIAFFSFQAFKPT